MTKELEYKIIGSVLLTDGNVRQKIFTAIGEEFFEDSQTKTIYHKLAVLFQKHPDADESAYMDALEGSERTAAVSALSAMMSPSIAERKLDDTLAAARELYAERKIRSRVTDLALSDTISQSDLRQLVSDAESLYGQPKQTSREKYLAEYQQPVRLLPTGFAQLDAVMDGGLRAGTLCTIGARPSTRKTTYATNIAAHNPDKRVLFVSIEMTAGMIYDRLITDVLDVDYSAAVRHSIQSESVCAVLDKFPNLSIVDDVSGVETIADLIYAENPDIVIVDFIQIVTSGRRFADNRQRIDYISQILKQAAKSTGCCIITLSQLTRAGKDKPTMSDLKESGGLEQDSDYVILLYRPYVNDKSAPDADPAKTTVTLDKNKFGSTAELKYKFNGKRQRFTEDDEGSIQKPANKTAEGAVNDDLPF